MPANPEKSNPLNHQAIHFSQKLDSAQTTQATIQFFPSPLSGDFLNRCHPPFEIGATHLFQRDRCHPPFSTPTHLPEISQDPQTNQTD
jgi:hypothetical protein